MSEWPPNSGEMAARIRAFDWAGSPLGPIESWPSRLKGAIETMLSLDFPAMICVGEGWLQLYNDSFATVLDGRHPAALGKDAHGIIGEDDFIATLSRVFDGETVTQIDHPYSFPRHGVVELAWFDLNGIPVRDEGGTVFAILILLKDMSERRKTEKKLRDNEVRQAFLLHFSDVLRPLAEPLAASDTACRLLAEHLDASRVQFTLVEGYPDAEIGAVCGEHLRTGQPVARRYPLANYGEPILGTLRSGHTLVIVDSMNDPRLSEVERRVLQRVESPALISVPLVKAGKLLAILSVHDIAPREWTAWDVELVEAVAERTWAAVERTRAETLSRESEVLFRSLFEGIDEGVVVLEPVLPRHPELRDWRYVAMNPAACTMFDQPDLTGHTVREFFPDEEEGWYDAYDRVFECGEATRFVRGVKHRGMVLEMFVTRVSGPASPRLLVVIQDVTARHRAAAELAQSEARQAFLLRLSDALALTGNLDECQVAAMCLLKEHLGTDCARYYDPMNRHVDQLDPHQNEELGHDGPMPLDNVGRLAKLAYEFGQTFVINNVATDPRVPEEDCRAYEVMGFQSAIGVPIIKHGHFVAALGVYCTAPRNWSQADIALVEETAERVWLASERATTEAALNESEKRLKILVAELQHRVRNILTVVRSVFARTVDTSDDLEEVADHFKGRLDALARTQVIVTRSAAGTADLENLIRDELISVGEHDGPRISIGGPDVVLTSKQAELLGLAVHELTTNALKYGALRVESATLSIIWNVNLDQRGARRLDLCWSEQGVPVVALHPAREGFGRELIEEALPYRLGAETRLQFRGGGVCCTISMPLDGTGPGASPTEDEE